jgi:uncharacterized protein (DUF2141 family)
MTIFLVAVASLFMPLSAPHVPNTHARKVTLSVELQSLRDQRGSVQVGLYGTSSGFPGKAKPMQEKGAPVKGTTASVSFEVDPGEYALAVYHDVNGNGKLDTGTFGIPKEPYGFSNNIRPRFSAPSFADCKVKVGESDKVISITVK